MNKIWLIAQREFSVRVKKKTFLLTTILLPLMIFGFYALMIYFSVKPGEQYTIAVADPAGVLGSELPAKSDQINFQKVDADSAKLEALIQSGAYSAYLQIPPNYQSDSRDTLALRSTKSIGLISREQIKSRLEKALREQRFLSLQISKARLDSLQMESPIIFQTSSGGKTSENRAGISYAVGFGSGFLIYIILFIYGTMVMRGVMEEKVSRIAEVIVSSARPFQLMMGKITGIGAVGLVQFIIWIVLVSSLQILIPLFMPGMSGHEHSAQLQQGMQAAEAMKGNAALDGLKSAMQSINIPLLAGCFLFYFLGGYLLYSSLFAAIGSAVNEDPQDAQSLMLPVTMPIIFSIVIMMKTVNDPNSSLAVFGSIFPLTSPVVMMARIAHGVPEGVSVLELMISAILLIGGFIFTTWMAGKIYRTGILLYGKKPSWKEMWKWAFRSN